MPTFFPATDRAEFELVEPGKYIATCTAIEDAPDKGFGPGVKWVFKLVDPATNQTVRNSNGFDLEFWQFTSTKMGPKARARPIIEALLGRTLENGEIPNSNKLIGTAMTTIIIHEPAEDGSMRARVTSCKPFQPADAAPAAPQPGFDANGNAVKGDAHADLVARVEKAARKAEVLQTPRHLEWLSLNFEKLTDGDLMTFLNEINADIAAA